jgi:uncharacterized delta-60 repeat protein
MLCASFVAFAAPGSLDPTFGVGGVTSVSITTSQDIPATSKLLVDGRIVIAGSCEQDLCLTRLKENGDVDVSFGVQGVTRTSGGYQFNATPAILEAPNGAFLLAATCRNYNVLSNTYAHACVVRYSADGVIDESFGLGGVTAVQIANGTTDAVESAFQSDGKLLILGACRLGSSPVPRYCLTRLSAAGQLDTTYGNQGFTVLNTGEGTVTDGPRTLVVDANDRAVVAGECIQDINAARVGIMRICLARVLLSGQQDASWGENGLLILRGVVDPSVSALTKRSPSGFLLATSCASNGPRFCLLSISENGALDAAFGVNGVVEIPAQPSAFGYYRESPSRTARSSSGFLFVAGSCYKDYSTHFCVKRLVADSVLDTTFGSGGSTIQTFDSLGGYTSDVHVLAANDKVILVGSCGRSLATSMDFCVIRLKGGPYDASTCTLNADLNNQVAGNDGVLAIRYLLGYTGNALTDGALGANPGRTAQQIESHFAQLKTDGKLDVDGDGEANALTDGLLILRAMLGLSGDALVAGARNASHPNVRDAKQILTWIELTHGVACLP